MSTYDDAVAYEMSRGELRPIVLQNLPFNEYLAIDAVNCSRLKLIEKSPKHYHANPGQKSTRSMGLGTLCHVATCEPNELGAHYITVPPSIPEDGRLKANKDFRKNIPVGLELIKRADVAKAKALAAEVKEANSDIFTNEILTELTIVWVDEETDITCKIRVDIFTPGVGAADLKTCQDCSSSKFPWDAKRYQYFFQAAFYRRGILAAQKAGILPSTGDDCEFFFIAAETGDVRASQTYRVPDEEISAFDRVCSDRLQVIKRCTEVSEWPCSDGVLPLVYPGSLDGFKDEENANEMDLDWGE